MLDEPGSEASTGGPVRRVILAMPTLMDGVKAKIARSYYHIHGSVDDEGVAAHRGVFDLIHDYIADHFDGLVTEQDHNQQPVIPARLSHVPLEVSVATGDVLHNLHSALDHLAWALVEGYGATPSEQTDFPIHLTRPKGKPVPMKLYGQIPPAAYAEIEGLQPYHAGHPSQAAMTPLGKLRELSNIDKHRYLRLMVTGLGPGSWVYPTHHEVRWRLLNYLDDGADFAPVEPEMSMQGHLVVQVTIPRSIPIGNSPPAFPIGNEPLYSTLILLHREVERIVGLLAPFVM